MITAVKGAGMYKKIFGDRVGSIRWLFAVSICLSLTFAVLLVLFWFHVEVIGEVCVIPMKGGGLIKLDTYGANVYCDPVWGMIAIAVIYYTSIFFAAIFPVFCLIRAMIFALIRK
tara:strand:- start:56 stop:400 length:345 start_codon:yes stop_codon:yes gene_type:complete